MAFHGGLVFHLHDPAHFGQNYCLIARNPLELAVNTSFCIPEVLLVEPSFGKKSIQAKGR